MAGKAGSLARIVAAEVLALALWFSGTAAGPGMLRDDPALGTAFLAALTSAVQLGFVFGTLGSAAFGLPDRVDPRRLFAGCCAIGGLANAALLALPLGGGAALLARLVTGIALAGIYPVGMKLAVGWSNRANLGLLVGTLVGGLTLGSALPHLVNALGGLQWRVVVAAASVAAWVAAGLIGGARLGPRHAAAAAFRPADALQLLRGRRTRLATLGYLGHMWELYAVWAWIGVYLAASFAASGRAAPAGAAAWATFGTIAVGALGCVAAGLLADRIGRVPVTVAALLTSAACCVLAGPLFGAAPAATVALCVVWGLAVVADSAQFSAAVADAAEPRLLGTMLTMQTALGFALTLVTIQLVPLLVAHFGWTAAFTTLALGPLLGAAAMLRLRRSSAPSGNAST